MLVIWLLVAVCFVCYADAVSKGALSEYKPPAPPPAQQDQPTTRQQQFEMATMGIDLAKFARHFIEQNVRTVAVGCGLLTILFVVVMCALSSDSCVRYKLNRNRRESILLPPNDD